MYTDLRQIKSYADYIKDIGWQVNLVNGVYIFIKKFLFWNFVKIQRPDNLNIGSLLDHVKRKYRFSTVYIEPKSNRQYQELSDAGFRKYNSPFLPSKTIQLDLTRSESELLKEMHYKTRYNIKHFLKDNKQVDGPKKITVSENKNIGKFADFWQKCAKERGMFISQKGEIRALYKTFGNEAKIHTVSGDKGNWLSSVLRISTKDVSYYMYAAATKEGKRLFTPTQVAWNAITAAKKEGKKLFDFEGIYDERFPLKSWIGFTRFKKGFGGMEVLYPGCLFKINI